MQSAKTETGDRKLAIQCHLHSMQKRREIGIPPGWIMHGANKLLRDLLLAAILPVSLPIILLTSPNPSVINFYRGSV
jgi:hypothetical protein